MKKTIIAVLIAAALFASLAACANAPPPAEADVSASPATASSTASSPSPSPVAASVPPPVTAERESFTEDGKAVLYIGAFSSGSFEIEDAFAWLTTEAQTFNWAYKDYEARVIDYGDASASEAMYRLNAEILAGKMPDILVTQGMPVDKYISMDLLYDMSGWLNAEDFYTGPLEAMKTDGKLYEVSPAITVTSFYGLNKYLGDTGALTLDDIYAAWERFNDGSGDKAFISGLSNELVCLLLVSAYEDSFTDKGAATCDFTSPEFLKLLEFCKTLPANTPELNLKDTFGLDGSGVSPGTLQMPELHRAVAVRKETALLGIMATSRLWGYPYPTHYLVQVGMGTEDYHYIGYLGAKDTAASMYLEFPVAVSAKTENIKGAKTFVNDLWAMRFMMRGGSTRDLPLMPLKRSVIQEYENTMKKDRESMAKEDSKYENVLIFTLFNEPVPFYKTVDYKLFEEIIDGAGYRVRSPIAAYLPPLNKSQVYPDRFPEAPPAGSFVNPIIAEEIHSFFGGVQDAAHTAELIQSRYSVYLNEQMRG
ncbi:MAG: hypothetical protein LBM98_01490 [Oscillospiraceae bacterium]|jgi:hypothetical protein|nr:hypothetical protein [Oscillospiraceae bacterium]